VVGVTRKHLGPEPYFVETGHDFPVPADSTEHLEISQTALAALRALGLGWGPAHVEVRQTVAGPRIVEVNPRLAGGMIPRMVQEACGIDMIFHVVAGAAGRGMPPRSTRTQAASIRFLVARTGGRLIEIHGEEDARRVPGVIDVVLTREPGQDVVLRHSFQDRLGLVLAAGEDGSVAARAADEGLLVLDARIAPGSFVTEGALG
jgi:biotin carboxylase